MGGGGEGNKILLLQILKQGDWEFEASLGIKMTPHPKKGKEEIVEGGGRREEEGRA